MVCNWLWHGHGAAAPDVAEEPDQTGIIRGRAPAVNALHAHAGNQRVVEWVLLNIIATIEFRKRRMSCVMGRRWLRFKSGNGNGRTRKVGVLPLGPVRGNLTAGSGVGAFPAQAAFSHPDRRTD